MDSDGPDSVRSVPVGRAVRVAWAERVRTATEPVAPVLDKNKIDPGGPMDCQGQRDAVSDVTGVAMEVEDRHRLTLDAGGTRRCHDRARCTWITADG